MKSGVTVMAVLASLAMASTLAATAYAARPSSTPTGNDLSFPQCGTTLPSGPALGIVAVNDGLANTTNSCLATEITWAQASSGTTNQPKASLYVNTANPGHSGVADWPASNKDPVTGRHVTDPYGLCAGQDNSDFSCPSPPKAKSKR